MSYHIYTTRGIVLSLDPRREADRVYSILTEDLGLVRASASGVRKEASKLRGSLEPYSISSISLVRGKGDWRITNAELIDSLRRTKNAEILRVFARVLSLVEKLVAGEEAHPELYRELEKMLEFVDESDAEALEVWLVSRVLYELGYLEREHLPADLSRARENKTGLIKAINEGLLESGLA